MESSSWFGDSHVLSWTKSPVPSREAAIVFRGFPGEPPPAELDKYKFLAQRRGIAAVVHEATGRDVLMFHYEGLGKSRGRFRFVATVERGTAFAENAAARYDRVHLIGYSWGGLVAYNAARTIAAKRGALAMISPVTDLGDDASLRSFWPPYVRAYPNIFGDYDRALGPALADLMDVRDRFNPLSLASLRDAAPANALIVHGSKDDEVPVESSRRFKDVFAARYLEFDDDHVYRAAWDRMLDEVARFVSAV